MRPTGLVVAVSSLLLAMRPASAEPPPPAPGAPTAPPAVYENPGLGVTLKGPAGWALT